MAEARRLNHHAKEYAMKLAMLGRKAGLAAIVFFTLKGIAWLAIAGMWASGLAGR